MRKLSPHSLKDLATQVKQANETTSSLNVRKKSGSNSKLPKEAELNGQKRPIQIVRATNIDNRSKERVVGKQVEDINMYRSNS